MRQPAPNDLRYNSSETEFIRTNMLKRPMIKITINVDTSTLAEIRSIASQTGVPYQRLLNRLLKESLIKKDRTSSRLDKLEKEVHRLKKTIAA